MRGLKTYITLFSLVILLQINTYGQDSTYLIANFRLQYDCSQSINDLYNFKFDEAEKKFNWMRQEFPEHPLPYYLLGLSNWWKFLSNENNTEYDGAFLLYMQNSIAKAKELYDHDNDNVEAIFFLAASYGLKARFYIIRGNNTKAISNSKKALKYLKKTPKNDTMDPEFLLGDGLYNYYREWIPDHMSVMKPVMLLFPRGDKEKGIAQLERVSEEAFYTRVEAMGFLLMVYHNENRYFDSYKVSRELVQMYPDNPIFAKSHLTDCMNTGRYYDAIDIGEDIYQKIVEGKMGYDTLRGRHTCYHLGRSIRTTYAYVKKISNDKSSKIRKRYDKKNEKYREARKKRNHYEVLKRSYQKKMDSVRTNPDELKKYKGKIKWCNKLIESYQKAMDKMQTKKSKLAQHEYSKRQLEVKYNTEKVVYTGKDLAKHEEAKFYFEKAVEFGNHLGAYQKGNHLRSLLYLAIIADENGQKEKAKRYCELVQSYSKKKWSSYKSAESYLKEYEKHH